MEGGKSFETIFGTFKKFARTERVSSASRDQVGVDVGVQTKPGAKPVSV